jgi:hypothetical protein
VGQTPSRQRPIRVAIHVADAALRERMTRALGEAGNFAPPGLGDADVTIADAPPDVAGPVIALAPAAAAAAWRSDVRAVLPADVDATTLGAVITVIAAGLGVAPPNPARSAGALPDGWLDNLAGGRVGFSPSSGRPSPQSPSGSSGMAPSAGASVATNRSTMPVMHMRRGSPALQLMRSARSSCSICWRQTRSRAS